MATILLVEDRESFRRMLVQALQGAGFETAEAKTAQEAIQFVHAGGIDLVVTDLHLPGQDGMAILKAVKAYRSSIPVVVITAYGNIETAVAAVRAGAYDFIAKPFEPDHLILQIEKALEKQRLIMESTVLKDRLGTGSSLVVHSKAMQSVLDQIRKVAQNKSTVILVGESGTGKEVLARAIHECSPRQKQPYVALNCAAIPHELLESECFGYERGAFTGATHTRIGKFELADKGTLFLDEIGDMEISLQAKLLRVLEDSALLRVGGLIPIKIDVRIIAATHRNLQRLIQQGGFREDLYFRLNVFPIDIPPLRERREDLLPLAESFIAYYTKEAKTEPKRMTQGTLEALLNHPFPGNVRELKNCIERAVILSDGNEIRPEHLGLHMPLDAAVENVPLEGSLHRVGEAASRAAETRMIRQALATTHGNKSVAARLLQVSYKTLLTKIKDYGIASSTAE